MSWRSYSCPSKETNEKSSVRVRLKKATSRFLAASIKLRSASIRVCSKGFDGWAGGFPCPAPAREKEQHSKIVRATKPYFIPPPFLLFIPTAEVGEELLFFRPERERLLSPNSLRQFR